MLQWCSLISIFTVELLPDGEHYAKLLFKSLTLRAQITKYPGLSGIVSLGKPPPTNSLKHELSLAAVEDSKRRKKQRKLECAQSGPASEGIEFNTLINFFFLCRQVLDRGVKSIWNR